MAARHPVTRRAHSALERRAKRVKEVVAGEDDLATQLEQARQELNHIRESYETWVPPGHFYSPYADLDELTKRSATIFDIHKEMVGIDFRADEQLALFDALAELTDDLPFPADKGDELRYYFDNPAYGWSDGIILHGMLRHIRPRRIVEVGSG